MTAKLVKDHPKIETEVKKVELKNSSLKILKNAQKQSTTHIEKNVKKMRKNKEKRL